MAMLIIILNNIPTELHRSPGTSNIIGTYIVNSDGYMSSSSYDIWNVSYGRGHVTLSVYWIYIWCKLC